MNSKTHLSNPLGLVTISLTAGAVWFSQNAMGQTIANENFNYNTGSGIATQASLGGASGFQAQGAGVNAATGFWNSKADPNAATEVKATSLSYTDGNGSTVNTSGGSLASITPASAASQPQLMTTSSFGALAAANTSLPGTLWMSFLWQGLNTTGSGSGLYRQSSVMFVNGANATAAGSGSERLDLGMPNISAANQGTVNPNFSLFAAGGLAGQTAGSTTPLQSGVAANAGATTFALVEMVLDNTTTTADTINVWLNPTLGVYDTGSLGTPSLTYSLQDLSGLNGIRIQSGNVNATFGSVGGQEQVDEITLGNTAASVESFTTVPEPASATLAAFGGAALLAMIRRRK